jgi:hypothetical protein
VTTAVTVEAVVAMSAAPMTASGTEADKQAGAIAIGIPAVAAPIAPAAMAMPEPSIMHRLGDRRLILQKVTRGG